MYEHRNTRERDKRCLPESTSSSRRERESIHGKRCTSRRQICPLVLLSKREREQRKQQCSAHDLFQIGPFDVSQGSEGTTSSQALAESSCYTPHCAPVHSFIQPRAHAWAPASRRYDARQHYTEGIKYRTSTAKSTTYCASCPTKLSV